jgi:outer membrane cobalamin receptor
VNAAAVAALTASLAIGLGCHRATSPGIGKYLGPGSGTLITDEDIARSGARTAWEVLRRAAPQFHFRETRSGQPARMTRRGESSILLNDAPLLMLDGVRNTDFRTLDQIPAHTIASIRIYTGIDATTYYGTNAVGGAIIIWTKVGTDN